MATADPKKAKAPAHAGGDSSNQPTQLPAHNFLREVYAELKPPKTKWPTTSEAWRITVVVMGVIVAIAVYMGAIDSILSTITLKYGLIK